MLARADAARPDGPRPPRELVPLLRFGRLPDTALAAVRRGLERDDAFRQRVWDGLCSRPGGVDALDEGARLFLARPEGWEQALAALVDAAVQEAEEAERLRAEGDALRRVEQLEATLEELRAEHRALSGEVEGLREERDEARRAGAEARRRRGAAERHAAELGDLRDEAVRQLKEAEALSAQRLERQRELEQRLDDALAAGPEPGPGPDPGPDRGPEPPGPGPEPPGPEPPGPDAAGAAAAVRSAAAAAAGLAAALAELAGSLQPEADGLPDAGPVDTGPHGDRPRPAGAAAGVPAGARGRRRPVRPGRGLSADSAGGLRELLGRAGVLVLVDGYNVSMQGWPGQPVADQRRYLLDLLGALRARSGADIQVVFDGATDGRRPAVGAPLPVRVHFTEAGVEADDRILEFVEGAPSDAGVVVVSSDHRVRDGARARGATPVSSSALLELGRSR